MNYIFLKISGSENVISVFQILFELVRKNYRFAIVTLFFYKHEKVHKTLVGWEVGLIPLEVTKYLVSKEKTPSSLERFFVATIFMAEIY